LLDIAMSSSKFNFEELTKVSLDKDDNISHHSEELQNGTNSGDESDESSSSRENNTEKPEFRLVSDDDDDDVPRVEPVSPLPVPEIVVTGPSASTELASQLEKLEKHEVEIKQNFVLTYLQANHLQYYNMLIQDLKDKTSQKTGDGVILLPAADTTSSNSTGTTEKKPEHDFPAVKSRGEEEAENLAKMCIHHSKYDEMIKKPMDAKNAEKNKTTSTTSIISTSSINNTSSTLPKSSDSGTVSRDPDNLGPDEYKIVVGNHVFIQNRSNGKALLITYKSDGCITYAPYFPNVNYSWDNRTYASNIVFKQIPMDVRKMIAAYKLAERLRGINMHINLKKFAWKVLGEKRKSIIEKYLSENNWSLAKTMPLSDKLDVEPYLATLMRKIWFEICKDMGVN
jgi:hypothetical protein